MTTLNREEVIEAMAKAAYDCQLNNTKQWDEVLALSKKEGYMVAKERVATTTLQAEAALDALLGMLPETIYRNGTVFGKPGVIRGDIDKDTMATIYQQLLDFKRE